MKILEDFFEDTFLMAHLTEETAKDYLTYLTTSIDFKHLPQEAEIENCNKTRKAQQLLEDPNRKDNYFDDGVTFKQFRVDFMSYLRQLGDSVSSNGENHLTQSQYSRIETFYNNYKKLLKLWKKKGYINYQD